MQDTMKEEDNIVKTLGLGYLDEIKGDYQHDSYWLLRIKPDLGACAQNLLNMVNASIQVVIRNIGLLQDAISKEPNIYIPGAANTNSNQNHMKKYIGTKQVKAEPMTYGDAYKLGLIRENAYIEEYAENPGYLVEYADGYKSWSPANVFEESYKVAETHLDRINIEDVELRERCLRLSDFIIANEKFNELPLGDRAMLVAQHHAMCAYSNILSLRQSTIEGAVEGRPYGFSFEQILPLIREGYAVRREGWNGKHLMVFKQVPAHITSDKIPNMQSLPAEAKRLILESKGLIDYTSQCLIYDSETGRADSWLPSISDVFATDWELVVE